MEEAEARAKDYMLAGAEVVSHAEAGIEILLLRVEHAARPGFPLPANSAVESQLVRNAPLVLNKQAVVGVAELALSCIANCRRDTAALIHSGIERGLVEIRRLEALKEYDVGVLTSKRPWPARVAHWRDTIRAVDAVVAKESAKAWKIRFKWKEQRERFGGVDVVEVAAETDGVLALGDGEVVDQLEAGFTVEVRIATIDAGGESVGKLKVWLRRDGRKIKGAASELHTQFVDHLGIHDGSERTGEGLVSIEIVLE